MISAGNDLGAASAAIDELRAELEAGRARIASLELIILEATPDYVFGRDDIPSVMAYTARIGKNYSHECEIGWHQMVMLGDHQRIVDQLRARGLSQEDRETLEPHSKWLHLASERLQKQQREYSIANTCEDAADAIDAILRRLGGQTT